MNVKKLKNYQQNLMHVQTVFIMRNWRLIMLQIQHKLILAWVA